jgi:hypothetical protein
MPVTNDELVTEILRSTKEILTDHDVTAERVAEKLDGDLDYKEPCFLKRGGSVGRETPAAKRIQQNAVKMVIDMLGLNAPDKHVFPGADGEPQDLTGASNLEMATKLLALAMERKKAAEEEES